MINKSLNNLRLAKRMDSALSPSFAGFSENDISFNGTEQGIGSISGGYAQKSNLISSLFAFAKSAMTKLFAPDPFISDNDQYWKSEASGNFRMTQPPERNKPHEDTLDVYRQVESLRQNISVKDAYITILKNLYDLIHRLFGITDKKVLLKSFTQNLCEDLGFSSAVLWVYDKSKHELVPISWSNVQLERLNNLVISETKRPYSDLLFHRKSFFLVDDIDERMPSINSPLEHIHQIRHVLESKEIFLFPIIGIENIEDMLENYNGKISTTAILMVGRHNTLNNRESRELLQQFSNSAGLILGNIDVYKYLQTNYASYKQQAFSDGLTGLYNRRFFNQELEREIQRSYRHFLNMSLIMIDVDHFKNYNDNNGHQAGDEALKKLGAILKAQTRICDVNCRYGGEELILILPETGKKQAAILAEKLRRAVAETLFEFQDKQPGGNFTISLGVSSFPDDAVKTEDLIQKADQALYHAKSTGRNKVDLYEKDLSEKN
jgi:diguanylate cyclase (GGDEF)-like protein